MTIHSRNKAVKLPNSIYAVVIFPDGKSYTYKKRG